MITLLSSFGSKRAAAIERCPCSPVPFNCSTQFALPEATSITATQGRRSLCRRCSFDIPASIGRNVEDTTTDCPSGDQLAAARAQYQYPWLPPSGALSSGRAVPFVRSTTIYSWGMVDVDSDSLPRSCGPVLIGTSDPQTTSGR